QLCADGAASPFASQTLGADCAACTVTFASAQVPIAPAQPLAHALSATATAPGGNTAQAARSINVDVNPPADAAPAVTVAHRLAGVVHVAIASAPGDDGVSGGAASSWQVRWSQTTPLTRANWDATGTLVDALLLPAPGTP